MNIGGLGALRAEYVKREEARVMQRCNLTGKVGDVTPAIVQVERVIEGDGEAVTLAPETFRILLHRGVRTGRTYTGGDIAGRSKVLGITRKGVRAKVAGTLGAYGTQVIVR